ncbi:MAG: DUF72 domain-containing protein [Dokdonella sp.]
MPSGVALVRDRETLDADPDVAERIAIGTASWTDKSLVGSKRFYPKGCSSAEERLRYYASQFPMVEVDSSYYALPSSTNSQKWVERTPDEFVFNIKAFRLFTGHQTPQAALPKDIQVELGGHYAQHRNLYYKDTPPEIRDELWRRYELAIRPLRESGKLAAVLFQFPAWVLPSDRALEHIDECIERMSGYQLATEFRRDLWFDESNRQSTLEYERKRGLVHVVVDAPPNQSKAVPAVWEVTNPSLAILRLHGRNVETWDDKDAQAASDRFNYDYSGAELQALVPNIAALAEQALQVQVIFNNNYEDQGQRNAKSLEKIISGGVYKRPRRE